MLNKLKKRKYQILELIIIFILTLISNLVCITMTGDEIWNYGFAYNIATGLIPYKDFNMVVTPLFPIMSALFMKILGINIVTFHIFNAIICTTIFYYMKKHIPKAYYIVYAIFLSKSLPNYNIACILLLYMLITMEDKKRNDYLIGIILGLTFLTKQNIGIFLCIPTLFTKDINKILKRIAGFIIPNFVILIYLLLNKSLYQYIDYTFLGVSSFAKENIQIYPECLIVIIISVIYLIYKYTKTKDIKLLYLLFFQLMAFPLTEPYHVMIPLIPAIGYLLSTLNLNKKIITATFIIFITIIFSVNAYNIYKKNIIYPNETNQYKYRRLFPKNDTAIKKLANYVNTIEDELYIISVSAYTIKLEASQKINKYDLLNNGNLGKDGHKKIINEIEENCNKKKCTFLIDIKELTGESKTQYNRHIIEYIKNNYQHNGNYQNYQMAIYKNY